MLKAEIRALYKNKRRTLSEDEVWSFSNIIFDKLINYFSFEAGSNVHVFLPIAKLNECNTLTFITWCWENNINIYVPKMEGEDLLSIPYEKNTVTEINNWGIPEPVLSASNTDHPHFDYVITPLLYADALGNRVGYGKGFYDRLFSVINKDAVKIGVNFFTPNETIDDVDPLDVPLDYLVTPTGVLSFGLASKSKK